MKTMKHFLLSCSQKTARIALPALAVFGLMKALPFPIGFEMIKLIFLVLITGGILHIKRKNWDLRLFVIELALLAGMLFHQAETPGREASLWAKSSVQTLSPQKADSIMRAYEASTYEKQAVKPVKPTKQGKPRINALLLSVLFFLASFGAFYYTVAAIFSSAFLFLFFGLLCLLFISATVYFLIRLFRPGQLKRGSEQSRQERRKEWGLYFKIFGVTSLATVAFFLIANRGTLF